jgi:pantothenate kinase type III
LENINLKNSRNSMIYLKQQRQHNDHKINHLSTQLEELKSREIHLKRTLLQHTAVVLNKGIQSIELQQQKSAVATPTSSARSSQMHDQQVRLIESELDQISSRVNYLYSRYCIYATNGGAAAKNSVDKLLQLDQQLSLQKQAKSAAKKG